MKHQLARLMPLAILIGLLTTVWECASSKLPASTEGPAVLVQQGGSIQAAIDDAASGTTIVLEAGAFRESLIIDRSVTVRGSPDGTVLEGSRFGAALLVIGDDTRVRIEQLTVTGGRGFRGHGIQTEDNAAVELVGVTSTGNSWCGVWARDRSTLVLEDCRLTANKTFGLYTWDFARVELRDCVISANGTHGIVALHASEIALLDCHIAENWSGLWAWDGVRIRATNTDITDNDTQGVVAQNAALIELAGSSVSNNADCGLWFCQSSRGVLRECLIQDNGRDGVLIEQDGIVEFYCCTILGNAWTGIRAAAPECVGGFDPASPYKGWIVGEANVVPGPGSEHGNHEAALCPTYPGSLWPPGFLAEGR